MKRYDSYKNSRLDWVPEIPLNWEIDSIGKVMVERSVKVSDTEYLPLSVTKNGIVSQLEGVAKTDNNENRKLVCSGDFVINSRSDRKGSSGYSNLTGSVSVINIVLEPTELFPPYTNYLFKSYLFIEEFFRNGKGIVMDLWSTRWNEMRYMKIPLPPFSEQQHIVSFLDTKTLHIDSLIEKTQRKIELLKEKRTSLINEVVTKGLNPNVEMKDSGVEWIGEIPSHWEVIKLKYFCELINEKGIPNNDEIKISPENVESNTGVCFNLYSEYSGEGVKFIEHDILLNKLRLYLKKVLFSEFEGFSMGEMIVLRIRMGISKYYFRTLFHQGLIDVLDNQSTGVKLPRVSPGLIMNTNFPVPPISEQQQIVVYLDEHTQLIDKTISVEQRRIDTLKEYRQSLISEVVTGKMDVRVN